MAIPRIPSTSVPLAIAAVLAAPLASGCRHEGDRAPATGTVTVTMTDGPSDELESSWAYAAEMEIRRDDGTTVRLLPSSMPLVRFSEIGDGTLVLRTAPVPAGVYTSATLLFALGGFRIAGETVDAEVVDSHGAPLVSPGPGLPAGTVRLDVTPPAGGFTVGAGAHHRLEIDVDIDSTIEVDEASNRVVVSPQVSLRFGGAGPRPPIQQVSPPLKADVAAGRLLGIDVEARRFDVGAGAVEPRGVLVACTASDSTLFQVNGRLLTGEIGLRELGVLGPAPRVRVFGALDWWGRLAAASVEAVSSPDSVSPPWQEVEGHIIAISGTPSRPVLSVLGHAVSPGEAARFSGGTYTVALDVSSTRVYRRGWPALLGTGDIAVGQLVEAFGPLTLASLDASVAGSEVRLLPTAVTGTVSASPTSGEVVLALEKIGPWAPSRFDFTVNGIPRADPQAFAARGDFPFPATLPGAFIELRGDFSIGTTGSDFTAEATVLRDFAAELRLRWEPASPTALFSFSAGSIDIATSRADEAVVERGSGRETVPSPLPLVLSGADPVGDPIAVEGFQLVEDGAVRLYGDFAAFSRDLRARTAAGARLHVLRASGLYDRTSNGFVASRATAVLE
jgi:hypothetical protein